MYPSHCTDRAIPVPLIMLKMVIRMIKMILSDIIIIIIIIINNYCYYFLTNLLSRTKVTY